MVHGAGLDRRHGFLSRKWHAILQGIWVDEEYHGRIASPARGRGPPGFLMVLTGRLCGNGLAVVVCVGGIKRPRLAGVASLKMHRV